MEFLKKNYEKILLGIVLFGLVVAVAFLLFLVTNEKQRLEMQRNSITSRPINPLPALNLNSYEKAIHQAKQPVKLDFTTTNKLFNPVRWLRAANGTIFPSPAGQELQKLEVNKITPLYLTISLESVYPGDSASNPARYQIMVQQQGALRRNQRGRRPYFMSVGDKNNVFTLLKANGPANHPTSLVLELADSGDQITISKNQPFKRVDGHMASMEYPPENRHFLNRRVGDLITVAGENYYVVAITDNEVVLSAQSNGKKYTIRYNARS